jgi:alanine-alpha-ketoisovalerate/valine-pyruvate aminotransferase
MAETTPADILITACEGGINNWASVIAYHPSQCYAKIVDMEIKTGETLKITEDVIRKGLNLIRTDKVQIAEDIVRDIRCDDIDSTAADCIVQVGLFGELRYS